MAAISTGTLPQFVTKVREGVYQYRHPAYVKEHGKKLTFNLKKLEIDFEKFCEIISELNSEYAVKKTEPKSSLVGAKVSRPPASVRAPASMSQIARLEFQEWSVGKHASAATMPRQRTIDNVTPFYKKIIDYYGTTPIHEIDSMHLNEFFKTIKSPHSHAKYLVIFRRLYAFARKNGAFPPNAANPPDDIGTRPIPPSKRMPLTMEQFNAIYEIAPDWMQIAMVIAMETSLRVSDILNLRFDDVKDGYLTVYPSKSLRNVRSKFGHDEKRLDFDLSLQPQLAQAIERGKGIADELNKRLSYYRNCPFIVSYSGRKRKTATKREHPMQISKEICCRTFMDLKRKVQGEVFSGYDENEMGGFHGIRKLSLDIIERQHGIEAAKQRAGHSSTKMTAHYVMAVGKRNVVSLPKEGK